MEVTRAFFAFKGSERKEKRKECGTRGRFVQMMRNVSSRYGQETAGVLTCVMCASDPDRFLSLSPSVAGTSLAVESAEGNKCDDVSVSVSFSNRQTGTEITNWHRNDAAKGSSSKRGITA